MGSADHPNQLTIQATTQPSTHTPHTPSVQPNGPHGADARRPKAHLASTPSSSSSSSCPRIRQWGRVGWWEPRGDAVHVLLHGRSRVQPRKRIPHVPACIFSVRVFGVDMYKVIEWTEATAQRDAPFGPPHKVEQAGRLGRVVPLRRLLVEAIPAKRKVGIHIWVVSRWWVIATCRFVRPYNSRRWASESFGAGAVAARTRWTQAAKRMGRSCSCSCSCCDGSSAMVGLLLAL